MNSNLRQIDEKERSYGMEIKRISNMIKRLLDEKGHRQYVESVTGTNGFIIGYLEHCETQGREIFQKDLEEHFCIRRSTVSAILKRMEEKGLVFRRSVSQDARLKKLVLTERSHEIHRLMMEDGIMVEKRIKQGITPEEEKVFFRVLDKIKANLEESV